MKKFECLYEGTVRQGNPTLLNEIYTELYITESESGEINNEHEVRQIEIQSRRAATEDTPIKCNDIFRPLPGEEKLIRTVLTKGVAGIGKTVSVQKFILDWAEGKENQDIQLIFPLPFKELNLMKDKTLSLSGLLNFFFPETKEMGISIEEYKVLFIFYGLDECRLSLEFKSKVKLTNMSESASVDVLLMNLIVGNLLPSALIWITSRPAAADLIPSECVHRVTEVRGFNEPQNEEYFRKRIGDQSLTNRIISHLKSSRSLYIMCHIPVFCWISATVLEKILSQAESGEIPKTLTEMYTHFLILQTNIKHEKDYEKNVTDEDMILKLGKLAFQQLVKGNLIFYDEDLRECGIDVSEASVYSGLCTQIFREELGLYQGKVFCFVHLSLQEHLAALYAHLSFTVNNINVFDQTKQSLLPKIFNQKKYNSLSELHQRALKKALNSKNGHLDLFLRFFLGFSVESNQTLLRKLLTQTGSCFCNKEETVQYIKEKIRENRSPEKSINLFHCLNELGDDSLMQEIQDYLKSGKIKETNLSSSQWSALVYVLLTSEQKMDVFDLKQFIGARHTADEILQNLLPVVKESRSVRTVEQKSSEPQSSFWSMKRYPSMDQLKQFKSGDEWLGLTYSIFHEILNTFRSNRMKKFECLYEGTVRQGNPTLLNEIYTELYITESESGEINNEHEVRQIEIQSRRAATEDTPIKCNDIFRPLPGEEKLIRTVLTKGVAGIGKTVSVQKFILDWAEGKENQDIQLIFPLPFKELNLMKDKTLSLSGLLNFFFPETKEMGISIEEYKVLFIFYGLDECRLSLEFKSKVKLTNMSESASVDVLLMNLIVGNLLPSALIWITSRPAAADLIPSECVHRVTEVRGFNEPQNEEYFRKRIGDQSLTNRIISHLKSSRSLYIMCHIPVFCWISATVLEKILSQAESGEIPKTLTEMYTHFLILQTNIKHEKDYEKNVTDEDMILKLGKLAFQQLVKGNLIFYDEDLRECGIDVSEASVYSGLCTQIFREELGLYQGKVFCFVHLSLQEHLAALYAHLSFTVNNINVFDQTKQSLLPKIFNQKKYNSLSELHQRALKKALNSKNGHLDLFLRFFLGFSVESNQTLLRKLLTQTGSCFCNKEETVQYIKEKIRENRSPEKSINLFHCLNELGDDSLMQEIQDYLKFGKIKETNLSSSQWSALVYVLLTSEQKMDVFDLKQFIGARHTADEILQNLLPVVKESRSVREQEVCEAHILQQPMSFFVSV
ncbi:NLR family CARD domain-containing protein 3 [Labeo rohita]|uniref:NLR family CARD domain-containing protein 3 n=1 Tax=Labeo rohita TaxID=84645 RepID=A0ABQ8MSQ9_LABRO|nr:NLR family CARD domain-containing protein 3 [Labeo rohita]